MRFDASDRNVAHELSREWAEVYFGPSFRPETIGPKADFEEIIFDAICECARRERESHSLEKARRRQEKLEKQMEIPF